MKKIGIFICSQIIGGHEYQARELIIDLHKIHHVEVFTTSKLIGDFINDGDFKSILTNKNYIPFFKKGNVVYQLIRNFKNLLLLFKYRYKFDYFIISAGTVEAGLSTILPFIFKKNILYVPMLVDRSVLWRWGGGIYNYMIRLSTNLFYSVITINKIQSKLLKSHRPISIIPNRIRVSAKVNTVHNLQKITPRLYFSGRIDHQKMLGEMLEWLDIQEFFHLQIIIIGDGPLMERLRLKAETLRFISVIFIGWINSCDFQNFINSNDILVLNSLYEGEPLVIREANELSISVISKRIHGVRGCTYPNQRFTNKNELIDLVNKGLNGQLRPFRGVNQHAVDNKRIKTILNIF